MPWIRSGETLIPLDSAGPLTHLNQMTISTFSNLCFLWVNPFSLLLGKWMQYPQILPSECFSFCHLPRITEELWCFIF